MAFLGLFGKESAPPEPKSSRTKELRSIARQSEHAMRLLIGIGIFALALLLAWALTREGERLRVLAWSFMAAFAALTIGGALGLLFGLPTAQTGSIGADGKGRDNDLGYRESTSLEQIADWLTKILIGLTLTQFASWEARFTQLARNLTETLFGSPPHSYECMILQLAAPLSADKIAAGPICRVTVSPIPGGVLLALYAVIGFLVSYLWMRRYFIHELVSATEEARALRQQTKEVISAATDVQVEAARKQAELEAEIHVGLAATQAEEDKRIAELAALEKEVDSARAKGLAPTTADPASSPQPSVPQLQEIIMKGQLLLPAGSKGAETVATIGASIADPPPDLEDPWRSKFGSSPKSNGIVLEAVVTETRDPNTFRIELAVRAQSATKTGNLIGTKAIYYLHPTFGSDARVSTFGSDGRAPLQIYAWGAFTVGVVTEDGTTLELNLATLEGAPDLFRMR